MISLQGLALENKKIKGKKQMKSELAYMILNHGHIQRNLEDYKAYDNQENFLHQR